MIKKTRLGPFFDCREWAGRAAAAVGWRSEKKDKKQRASVTARKTEALSGVCLCVWSFICFGIVFLFLAFV